MESHMERSDTMTILQTFDSLLHDGSISGRFNSQDFRDILNDNFDEEPICKVERSSSGENWSSAESDVNLGAGSSVEPDINLDTDLNFNLENLHTGNSYFQDNSKKYGEILLINGAIDANSALGKNVFVINEEESALEDNSLPALTSMPTLIPSLSLQPWDGDLGFKIGVQTSSYGNGNSKWVYSNCLKKLFMKLDDAVPIEVKVSSWLDAYINITPVFVSSQFKSVPVRRCHHHKATAEGQNNQNSDHILQVDNPDAIYKFDGLRHSVDIPLGVPAPGESARLLFVKFGCWNTCTGGPDRKQFCLVFTLFSGAGEEIGRQILNLKVCACPVRDCQIYENKFANKEMSKKTPIKKKKASPAAKAVKKIKTEIGERTYEQIMVPSEFSDEVKKYINRLVAEKYAKENNVALPFPQL